MILVVIAIATLPVGRAEAQNMLHNSVTTSSTAWGASGWGIAGGKYGAFVCETCHSRTTTNIKRIKTSITSGTTDTWPNGTVTTNTIVFTQADGSASDMGSTAAPWDGVCNVCHNPTKHTYYSYNSYSNHNPNKDCTICHKHKNGFKGPGCLDCHASYQGGRIDTANQFNANSHHVQGRAVTTTDCYKCHWEANSNGTMNATYHPTAPGGVVDLVIWGTSTVRPAVANASTWTTYNSANLQRAEVAKVTNHCLGCHNNTLASSSWNVQPFGDGKAPNYYAWDGSSIASRYSQTGTTMWGKYSYANGAAKQITKAYSAHGNAAANQHGWTTTNGYEGTIPNQTGSIDVECFDCHNSHGSNAAGVTSSYTDSLTNGAILKYTVASYGGYTANYVPTSGGTATLASYNAGAALCFDCHQNSVASSTRPWGYLSTYQATTQIMGYLEKPYWYGASYSNSSGPQMRYTYKNAKGTAGSHFGASSALNSSPTKSISGLCTPCHDPHGVSQTNVGYCNNWIPSTKATCTGTWVSDQQYGVPLLKGTWITSPYQEDAAYYSAVTMTKGGGRCFAGFNETPSQPGYHIDQNTFVNGDTNTYKPSLATSALYNLTTAAVTSKVSHTDVQFAGLCLSCHTKSALYSTAATTWGKYQRVHNSVRGWGRTTGNNANNSVHAYTCSKCHGPHSSCLPRLNITNCTDWNHRGRLVSGGKTAPQHSTSSSSGGGRGRFPWGGGGFGRSNSVKSWPKTASSAAFYWGTAGTTKTPIPFPAYTCHSAATGTYSNNRWNSVTPW
ncbi:MAG: hypothetical protein M0042_09760 [Nitrospiraceae bacterium]|nr:hypothetical protein [Nitrospiraceae bacterium]